MKNPFATLYRSGSPCGDQGHPIPDADGTTRSIPHEQRNQRILATTLVLTAGYVDGYGLLTLGAYLSFMSGNTTTTGVMTGHANLSLAVAPATAIVGFLAGSVVGNLVMHWGLRHARRVVFGLVAGLLLIGMQIANSGMPTILAIATLSLSMATVNPALSKIGSESVSLTFVTGTLNRIGSHLALAARRAAVTGAEGPWDTHLYRARIDAQLWIGFVGGAVLSGIVMSFTRGLTLVPAIAFMLVLALTSHTEPRSR